MPVYAHLENQDLPCPECGSSLRIEAQPWTHYIKFWWGYCASRSPGEVVYRIGDAINWRSGKDGVVHEWASFGARSFNVGDPRFADLTVTDIWGDVCQLPWNCLTCGTAIGGAAIEIRAGLIEDVWIFRPDELASEAYYLIQPDGSRLRMQEWENRHPRESDYFEP